MPPVDGTLVTIEDAKASLGIQDTEDEAFNISIDKRVSGMILRTEALLQGYIGRRLIAVPKTEYLRGGGSFLQVKNYPISREAELSIVDTNDDSVIPIADLQVLHGLGRINRKNASWGRGDARYAVTYSGGLDQDPDWDLIREELAQSVLDFIADLYFNVNPRTKVDNEGGGVGTTYTDDEIPHRIRLVWNGYKPIVV